VNQATDAEKKQRDELSRRDFLKRAGYASAAALVTGGLSLALYDSKSPDITRGAKSLAGLGDYALHNGKAKMAIVRGADRKMMVERGLQALGGMETFVAKGDRVLIKVNAVIAAPAHLGATTHPDILATLAGLCLKAGASQVLVTDNPTNNPNSCFEITGLTAAAQATGARIITPRAALFVPVSLPGGKLLQNWPIMAGVLQGVTKVIIASPVKDHNRAGATLILKNIYGFLGGRRNVFHQDINGIITELAQLLKPTLCVLDGTVSMMTNGPTGGSLSDLKDTGTLVVSTDPVAADAVGVELLGKTLADIPYLLMAEKAGAGQVDYRRLNPVMVDIKA
jgi:uncharacterized protein (DUF362 family)